MISRSQTYTCTINSKLVVFLEFPLNFNVVMHAYEITTLQDVYMDKIPHKTRPQTIPNVLLGYSRCMYCISSN